MNDWRRCGMLSNNRRRMPMLRVWTRRPVSIRRLMDTRKNRGRRGGTKRQSRGGCGRCYSLRWYHGLSRRHDDVEVRLGGEEIKAAVSQRWRVVGTTQQNRARNRHKTCSGHTSKNTKETEEGCSLGQTDALSTADGRQEVERQEERHRREWRLTGKIENVRTTSSRVRQMSARKTRSVETPDVNRAEALRFIRRACEKAFLKFSYEMEACCDITTACQKWGFSGVSGRQELKVLFVSRGRVCLCVSERQQFWERRVVLQVGYVFVFGRLSMFISEDFRKKVRKQALLRWCRFLSGRQQNFMNCTQNIRDSNHRAAQVHTTNIVDIKCWAASIMSGGRGRCIVVGGGCIERP